MTTYCVIGAGAAGLSTLHALRQAGHEVDCFEQTDRVGGHWNTDYEALHLITSRDQTVFEDFPMPESYPYFPRRDEVRDYIHSFAREQDLLDAITFGTRVASVVPIATADTPGSAGWTVTLDSGETRTYDGVFVANGHLWDAKIPAISEGFTGPQLHSSQYRNPGDLAEGRVLVVGAGNSGCDLAVDAAQHRFEVDVVVRHGVFFQPKSYFGVPRQELPWMAQFSAEEQDFIARMLARVSLGEPQAYGLPEPQEPTLAEGRAVVNNLLLYWLQHGRIHVAPGIDRIEGRTVYFEDGTSREYGTILWATGFHSTLPFLDDALVPRRNGVPLRYAGGLVPQGLEKLYYIGLTAPRGPQIPIYGIQAKLALKMIALHESDPSGFAGVQERLSQLQDADDVIDIVRTTWFAQLEDTERLLEAFATARAGAAA
ncbi:flavin-containing monooxygenase [Microbacterium excoecariae]|uniref:flavin-containing monooxygenase n=1 Tax=Microbacterium excoecariae TaxID=2715210 RepID=UPI0014084A56|nr:NAD(P)-binding domain-containing protein [Microbacterium excoecariae]NHI16553.1 NAD(P)-binding domain-containing protein [Microbacterium excoecariae]